MPTQDFKGTINGVTPPVDALKSNGTAGRVMRMSDVLVQDGADANTIKVEMRQVWNGNTIAEQNNLAKGGSVADKFSLDASGTELKILDASITGTVLACLAGDLANTSNIAALTWWRIRVSGSDISVLFSHDITTFTTGHLAASFQYITSA